MSTNLDWSKLVAKNRVKAPGMQWSEEERAAIAKGVDPDDVRAGLFEKPEDVPGAPLPVERMKRPELVAKAKELGIKFDEKFAVKADLILEIKKTEKANRAKAKLEAAQKAAGSKTKAKS
jgi:hypothetical protein